MLSSSIAPASLNRSSSRKFADAIDIAFSPTGDTIALGSPQGDRRCLGPAHRRRTAQRRSYRQTQSRLKLQPLVHSSMRPSIKRPSKKSSARCPRNRRSVSCCPNWPADDEDRRVAAYERATRFRQVETVRRCCEPNWRLKENEAVAILSAGTIAEFPPPPPDADWQDGYHTALTLLWRSPHPSLLPLVEPAYEKQPRGVRRAALLALLGILGTREAAETFVACIRKFGWPPLYDRVWWELEKLLAHGDVLLPDIASAAGKEEIGDLVDAITSALAEGTLKLEKVAGRLDALTPVIVTSIKKLIKQLSKYQTRKGIAWRFGDNYSDARYRLERI